MEPFCILPSTMGIQRPFLTGRIPHTSRHFFAYRGLSRAESQKPDRGDVRVIILDERWRGEVNHVPFADHPHPHFSMLEFIAIDNERMVPQTDTRLEVKELSGSANVLPNDVLAKVAQKNLQEVGGFRYTPEEQLFAEKLQKSLPPESVRGLDSTTEVTPLTKPDPNSPQASTDAGDVSWNVPLIGFGTATFVPGVTPHTWQAAACAGMSIGQKGMVVAAKALAMIGIDLFTNPKLVADAKADFRKQMEGKTYKSAIPEGQIPH